MLPISFKYYFPCVINENDQAIITQVISAESLNDNRVHKKVAKYCCHHSTTVVLLYIKYPKVLQYSGISLLNFHSKVKLKSCPMHKFSNNQHYPLHNQYAKFQTRFHSNKALSLPVSMSCLKICTLFMDCLKSNEKHQ